MQLAAVLWNDRHSDPSIHLFTEREAAIAWARKKAKEYAREADDFQEIAITPSMENAGWIYCANYSCENDGLRVQMVTVDKDA